MNVTGWSRGLEVSGGGQGVVSHAGLALLRHLADKTGLTGGLARALATARLLVHDRGRVLADLACAIADGARVISDFRVMGDQGDGGEGRPSPSCSWIVPVGIRSKLSMIMKRGRRERGLAPAHHDREQFAVLSAQNCSRS